MSGCCGRALLQGQIGACGKLSVLSIIGRGIRIDKLGVLGTRQVAVGDSAGKRSPLLEVSRPHIDYAVEAARGKPFPIRAEGQAVHPPKTSHLDRCDQRPASCCIPPAYRPVFIRRTEHEAVGTEGQAAYEPPAVGNDERGYRVVLQIPQTDRVIGTSRCQLCAIWTKGETKDRASWVMRA